MGHTAKNVILGQAVKGSRKNDAVHRLLPLNNKPELYKLSRYDHGWCKYCHLGLGHRQAIINLKEPQAPKLGVKTAFRRKKATADEKAEQADKEARQEREAKKPRPDSLRSLYNSIRVLPAACQAV